MAQAANKKALVRNTEKTEIWMDRCTGTWIQNTVVKDVSLFLNPIPSILGGATL